MTFDKDTFYVWIGGSCDYGHKERAGAGAAIIQKDGKAIDSIELAEFGTTEFRMMLKAMSIAMKRIPEMAQIVFLTNVSYLTNFDKTPTETSSNQDLIMECIKEKERHKSVLVKVIPYHKFPILKDIHDTTHRSMDSLRRGL